MAWACLPSLQSCARNMAASHRSIRTEDKIRATQWPVVARLHPGIWASLLGAVVVLSIFSVGEWMLRMALRQGQSVPTFSLRADALNSGPRPTPPGDNPSPAAAYQLTADAPSNSIENQLTREQRLTHRALLWSHYALLLITIVALALLLIVFSLFLMHTRRRAELHRQTEAHQREMLAAVAARTDELSELSTHLLHLQDSDKAALARHLHGDLGGLLTAAKLDLSWLNRKLKGDDEALRVRFEALSAVLEQAINVKRALVENLRPSLLAHFGLTTALSSHFDDTCRAADLNCIITLTPEFDQLDENVSLGLFRVAQAALENVIKFAHAHHVCLTLSCDESALHLGISDDGIGFSVEAQRSAHGIAGMRHRVRAMGGTFAIESAPSRGTRITVAVPRVTA